MIGFLFKYYYEVMWLLLGLDNSSDDINLKNYIIFLSLLNIFW